MSVFEHATIDVTPGREDEFQRAVSGVGHLFPEAGAHAWQLRRCIEEPSRFVLLVEWETVEAHTVEFRGSPLFAQWRGAVAEFFAGPPSVQHYTVCP